MAKFMVTYSSDLSAKELMANSTPEQMQAVMNDWIKWHEEASKTAKVEFGLPLQALSRVSPNAVEPSDSHISGYSTIEADLKSSVEELLKNHPHLQRPGAWIDLFEMLPMPGMSS